MTESRAITHHPTVGPVALLKALIVVIHSTSVSIYRIVPLFLQYHLSPWCVSTVITSGKPHDPLRIHLREQLYAARICDLLSPIGRPRATAHGYKPIRMPFTALDQIHPSSQGGDLDRNLLQREARFIYRFRVTQSPGINEDLSFKSFL